MRTVQIASPHRFSSAVISGRPLVVVFERTDTIGLGIEPAGYGAVVSNLCTESPGDLGIIGTIEIDDWV